jgi:WD40 repeat protein
MRRLLSITTNMLGLLVLIALVVALLFTFSEMRRVADPTPQTHPLPIKQGPLAALTAQLDSQSVPETFQSPLPSPTPPPPPSVPPCDLTVSPKSDAFGPPLDAFVFSQPQVVLTHKAAIGIASPLPDGESLLITLDVPGTDRQSIEVFNIRTGESHVYAERTGNNGKPVWLAALEAAAYSTLVGQQYELRISQGDAKQTERVAPSVEGLSLAAGPEGRRLLYLPGLTSNRPEVWDGANRSTEALQVNLDQWKYPKYPKDVQSMLAPSAFQVAWRLDGSQLVFYTLPWTFLFDIQTNQVCEIDLGPFRDETVKAMPIWALEAKWSPDGRYLALITTDSFPGQASGTGAAILATELTIVDMKTGQLRNLQPTSDVTPAQHYVTDIAWSPDSQYVATLGIVGIDEMGSEKAGVFIIEASTGKLQPGPSDYELGGGLWGWQLAWSVDGSQLVVACPTPEEGKLCTVSLKLKDVPES